MNKISQSQSKILLAHNILTKTMLARAIVITAGGLLVAPVYSQDKSSVGVESVMKQPAYSLEQVITLEQTYERFNFPSDRYLNLSGEGVPNEATLNRIYQRLNWLGYFEPGVGSDNPSTDELLAVYQYANSVGLINVVTASKSPIEDQLKSMIPFASNPKFIATKSKAFSTSCATAVSGFIGSVIGSTAACVGAGASAGILSFGCALALSGVPGSSLALSRCGGRGGNPNEMFEIQLGSYDSTHDTLRCPVDHHIRKMWVNAGRWDHKDTVGSVMFECSDGTRLTTGAGTPGGAYLGGTTCPSGKVATGFKVRHGSRIDAVALVCDNYPQTGYWTGTLWGFSSGSPAEITCGRGQHMYGVEVSRLSGAGGNYPLTGLRAICYKRV